MTLRGTFSLLNGDELYNAGTFNPGTSDGDDLVSITINGDYQQVDLIDPANFTGQFLANTVIDIAGAAPGIDHDLIDIVDGAAIINGGTLIVNLLNGFVPAESQTFNVMGAPLVEGLFNFVSMPGLPAPDYLNVEYSEQGVTVSVEALDVLMAFADTTQFELDSAPSDSTLADLDNDGDLDLILVVPDGTSPTSLPGEVVVVKNAGTDALGNWLGFERSILTAPTGVNPVSVAVGLMNGDAFIDVATANRHSNDIAVLFNNGTGDASLILNNLYPVGEAPVVIAAGGLPGDMSTNLVVGSHGLSKIEHLENDGSGSYSIVQTFVTQLRPVAVVLADVDHDSDHDLISAHRDLSSSSTQATLEVRLLDAASVEFGIVADQYLVGVGTDRVAIADLNADSFNDVVALNPSQGTLSVLINEADGKGDFGVPALLPIGANPSSLLTNDLDADGDPDLAALVDNAASNRVLRLIRNDLTSQGQVIFATAIELDTDGDPQLAFAGDLNSDMADDVLVVSTTAGIAGGQSVIGVRLNESLFQPCPADLFPTAGAGGGDGIVGPGDLGELLANWGSCPGCEADIFPVGAPDGIVGPGDLGELLANWGACG